MANEHRMMNEHTRRTTKNETIELDAPTLPQSVEEAGQRIIHVDDLSPGQKIIVQVANYQKNWHASPGDKIQGYLNDTPSENVVYIDKANIDNTSWDTEFDPGKIPNGSYRATYTKTNEVGDLVDSLPQPVTIEGSTASNYPNPLFPDAVDGVLRYAQLSEHDGTPIKAEYGLQQGDQVTFHWQGFDEAGREVPQAAYETNPPIMAQAADVYNGYIQDTIPLSSIQPLGDLGSGVAYYEVLRQGATHPSLNTKVEISWSDITALQLTSTQGAAKQSNQLPNLKPCNCGTVFGEPGLSVTISVSAGCVIAEAQSGDPTTYRTQLDGDGLATFSMSTSDQSMITIVAYSNTLPGDPPVENATFSDYLDGSAAGLMGYNYTTHVPSDGATACSIYFQVLPAFIEQVVTVTIVDEDSHATIVGADPDTPHTRTVTLYSDGCGWAQIVDTKEEKVNVALSVTGQTGSLQFPYPVEFISFPSAS
ncbi:hypothetical protein [Trinickia acidisoli]|uniref:hypothetical protein n=1 Tax=Trinickia acidisoli TaxID=2767482 RepID=UPI001A8D04D4|nr:hypothetical protein [Trinickia acidisoli]